MRKIILLKKLLLLCVAGAVLSFVTGCNWANYGGTFASVVQNLAAPDVNPPASSSHTSYGLNYNSTNNAVGGHVNYINGPLNLGGNFGNLGTGQSNTTYGVSAGYTTSGGTSITGSASGQSGQPATYQIQLEHK